jgi:outer membrane protein OmpA-like peptidoglycan-associated protein
LVGLSSAIGGGVGDEIVGSATTSLAWQPPDIPGTVSMVKGEVSGPLVDANAGFLHVYGSEIYPPMQVLFSSADFKPEGALDAKGRPSRKALRLMPELGGSWGKIQSKSFPDIDYTTVNIRTDHAVESHLTEDVHFCVDSAILTADARQALRIMCASELPALLAPTSRLTILGHTDRSDTASRNLTLSAMRAANAFQAIEDILGRPPAMSGTQLIVVGKGENEALKAGERDNTRNPTYRRVDIILNGRLVLTLKAQ